MDKKRRISKEKRRLQTVFAEIDANQLKIVQPLIERAAFIIISLQNLEDELNEKGWTEEYQNGENQYGVKKAAAADVHISLTKNLTSIIKQLLELTPPAQKKDSRLQALMRE